jgi:uncharacterized protein YjbJ (UPF0337 family)
MNWDRIEGNWKQLADNVKRQWGKLTDGQLDFWTGKDHRPKPVAHVQARRQQTALWLNPLAVGQRRERARPAGPKIHTVTPSTDGRTRVEIHR